MGIEARSVRPETGQAGYTGALHSLRFAARASDLSAVCESFMARDRVARNPGRAPRV